MSWLMIKNSMNKDLGNQIFMTFQNSDFFPVEREV